MTASAGVDLTPIFISAEQAARILGLSKWMVYKLLDTKDDNGEPAIASQYQGKRRLIRYESVISYADGLPTEAVVGE